MQIFYHVLLGFVKFAPLGDVAHHLRDALVEFFLKSQKLVFLVITLSLERHADPAYLMHEFADQPTWLVSTISFTEEGNDPFHCGFLHALLDARSSVKIQ